MFIYFFHLFILSSWVRLSGRHVIRYDDEDKEELDLDKEVWKPLVDISSDINEEYQQQPFDSKKEENEGEANHCEEQRKELQLQPQSLPQSQPKSESKLKPKSKSKSKPGSLAAPEAKEKKRKKSSKERPKGGMYIYPLRESACVMIPAA